MDNFQLSEDVKQRFLELPEVVQDLIVNSHWEERVRTLTQKNNLRIDQGAAIEREVLLVMLGAENPEKFTQNLMNEASLSQDVAEAIENEVAQEIFQPIKEALVQLMESEEESAESSTMSSASPKAGTNSNPLEENLESREEILKSIEDPDESVEKPAEEQTNRSVGQPEVIPEINTEKTQVEPNITENSEISNPTIEENKIEINTEEEKPKNTRTFDPYREPIE